MFPEYWKMDFVKEQYLLIEKFHREMLAGTGLLKDKGYESEESGFYHKRSNSLTISILGKMNYNTKYGIAIINVRLLPRIEEGEISFISNYRNACIASAEMVRVKMGLERMDLEPGFKMIVLDNEI